MLLIPRIASFSMHSLCIASLLIAYLSNRINAQSSSSLFGTTVITEVSEFSNVAMAPFTSAYQVLQPSVTISYSEVDECQSKADVISHSIDLALTSCSLTLLEATLNPSIQQFPLTSVPIVPIYNVLGVSETLSFSMQTLGMIFAGLIHNWNDSQIQQDNPGVLLPPNPIFVITNVGSAYGALAFTTAIADIYPNFANYVQPSRLPIWPSASYAATLQSSVTTITVIAIPYSISFASWMTASEFGNTIGNIRITSSSPPVAISVLSASIATDDIATVRVQNIPFASAANNITLDLNAAPVPLSWPIIATEYAIFDTSYSRSTCLAREALAEFLIWIFTSAHAEFILEILGSVSLPEITQTQINLPQRLATGITCRGATAIPQTAVNGITVSGDARSNVINSLLLSVYNTQTSTSLDNFEYIWQSNPSALAMEQLIFGEISVAMVFGESIDPAIWNAMLLSPDFVSFPVFLFGVEMLFNLNIAPGVVLPPNTQLTLSLPIITRIMFGLTTSWKDPSILTLNPLLSTAIGNRTAAAVPINVVLACNSFLTSSLGAFVLNVLTSGIPLYSTIFQLILNAQINACNAPLQSTLLQLLGSSFSNNVTGIASFASLHLVNNEAAIAGAVGVTTGGFGYHQFGDVLPSNVASINLDWNSEIRSLSIDSMLACTTDTWDQDLVTVNIPQSQNPVCYPLTQAMYLILNSNYTSSVSGPSSCISGALAIEYASFLVNQTSNDVALHQFGIARTTELAIGQNVIDGDLYANPPVCDNVSLLAASPTIFTVNPALVQFAKAMTVLGLIFTVSAMIAIVYYRSHPAIYSSKLVFVATAAVGLCMLFASLVPITQQATDASCSSTMWLVNLGYTCLFVPTYLKAFRVYSLYGGGALQSNVHHVKTTTLYLMLAAAIAMDVIFVGIWQAVSPLAPYSTIDFQGDPPSEYVYNQCGESRQGYPFLYVVGAIKLGALVIAAIVSFTTRRVITTYNEQKQLSLALYNAVIALTLCVPIILSLSINGDGFVILQLLCVLWISFVSFIALFVPKLMHATSNRGHADALQAALTSHHDLAKSVSVGFSFQNVGIMAEDILEAYIQALESQLKEVRLRMATLGVTSAIPLNQSPSHASKRALSVADAEASSQQRRATLANAEQAIKSPSNLTSSIRSSTNR